MARTFGLYCPLYRAWLETGFSSQGEAYRYRHEFYGGDTGVVIRSERSGAAPGAWGQRILEKEVA